MNHILNYLIILGSFIAAKLQIEGLPLVELPEQMPLAYLSILTSIYVIFYFMHKEVKLIIGKK